MSDRNKFYIPLIACRERQAYIDELVKMVRIDDIFYDDEHRGPLGNTIRALESDKCNDCDYIMMLQDDCIPCNNLVEICSQIVDAHPDNVIALFPWDFLKNTPSQSDTPFYEADIVSGLGLILPQKYHKDYLKFARTSPSYFEDSTMKMFCEKFEIKMIQTIPALVQHRQGKSILTPKLENEFRITKYFTKNPVADWSNEKVVSLEEYGYKRFYL